MIEAPLQSVYRRLFKPGFWRIRTSLNRALPDFLVIGAMRGGTTSLYDALCRHPGVAPAIKKEIHFFDLEFSRGLPWYRAHFPAMDALHRSGRLTGEASPYYLSHPLAAPRAAQAVPDVRLVAVLRNPADRAYSHYWHSFRLKVETLSFEDALAAEAQRLAGEEDRIRTRTGYRSRSHQHLAYRLRSQYADELSRWLAVYPRAQLLVLSSERFSREFGAESKRLFTFLGLDGAVSVKRPSLNAAAYPAMAPETRRALLAHFEPHNERLFELIGERFDWWD